MSERPAYFIVQRLYGREVPAIFWEELPRAPIRNLEYVVRLDQLPNGLELARASLDQLFAVYQHLKKRGKLPPRWEPPPKPKPAATTTKIGHRESQRALIDRARQLVIEREREASDAP